MSMILSNTQLFRGIEEEEISALLQCLGAEEKTYRKGEVIFAEGTVTEHVGMVLSGMALISFDDIWGNKSILGNVAPGAVFG